MKISKMGHMVLSNQEVFYSNFVRVVFKMLQIFILLQFYKK